MDWLDIIQWATPVFGGIVGWWVARINRRVDSQKQLLDALDRQNEDLAKVYEEMGYIRRAVERRNTCRYLPVCPVDVELRRYKTVYRQQKPHPRQYKGEGNHHTDPDDSSTVTGRPPPEPG